jgi:uncharacterized protein with von Willebrand factor type A (vWA) domain
VKVKVEDAIILCLDKSGSMSGGAYEALKEGAILVSDIIFGKKECKHFVTIFFDGSAETFRCDSMVAYRERLNKSCAEGGTNFGSAFD